MQMHTRHPPAPTHDSAPVLALKGPLTILVVDDMQETLELLEDVLKESGYATLSVRNGLDALDRLRHTPVHMIIADAMMPKMDGFQLCREVKADARHRRVPFVMYTANYVDTEDAELARSVGVDRYVVKNDGLAGLVAAVNDLARQRYGFSGDQQPEPRQGLDDVAFLEKHHAIIGRKLEEKMAELEMYAESLARKNLELQSSELRYRSLFEQAAVAIVVVDARTGRVMDVNARGLELLGTTRETALALPRFPLLEGEPPYSPSAISGGEVTFAPPGGETLTLEMGAIPLAEPRDPRVMLFLRDVTEARQMRQQLIQAERMMLLGTFAAGIAHDIRNPLAAVTLNLQYYAQRFHPAEAERETIEAAMEGTRRIEQIIESTLNLARQNPAAMRTEDLNAVVGRALWFIATPAKQRAVKVETRLSPGLAAVTMDARQIQQVLMNVMQNAVEASPQGGLVVVETGPAPAAAPGDSGRVAVTLTDHGCGINAADLGKLFKPLRTTKVGGTGLGLAMAKHIMDLHQGEILVESKEGAGTTVRLLFPVNGSKSQGGLPHVEG
jgi:signal transduction histidine kinase/CheY-like chemotaxis protein